LKQTLNKTKYCFTKTYTNKSDIDKNLNTCTHVYVKNDTHTMGVKPTYIGPFEVLEKYEKYFVLLNNRLEKQKISIDRIKPAYIN